MGDARQDERALSKNVGTAAADNSFIHAHTHAAVPVIAGVAQFAGFGWHVASHHKFQSSRAAGSRTGLVALHAPRPSTIGAPSAAMIRGCTSNRCEELCGDRPVIRSKAYTVKRSKYPLPRCPNCDVC